MRTLLFSGKGGVGKTSLAAATGIRLAQCGHRTLVMSVDPAHSLGDSFDIGSDLFTRRTADPLNVRPNLDIQEINIQQEIKRHWQEISTYIVAVLRTSGISGVEAEELAILPGMEELSAMMYVNQYHRSGVYDAVVLDCAPTAESLRFVSMPTTLDWYMKHVFPLQRTVLKAVRPLANRVSPVELPTDRYFGNVADLAARIQGVDKILEDPLQTSVRLVTNAERMVLRETQRAFVYFSLHGLTVDRIFVNRVYPAEIGDQFFAAWRRTQSQVLTEIEAYFAPVPVRRIPLFQDEICGLKALEELARILYEEGEDPAAISRDERPYSFEKVDGRYEVHLRLPFAAKGEIGLFKKGDELVIQVGTLRRHIGLPTSMAALNPAKAKLEDGLLRVEMRAP